MNRLLICKRVLRTLKSSTLNHIKYSQLYYKENNNDQDDSDCFGNLFEGDRPTSKQILTERYDPKPNVMDENYANSDVVFDLFGDEEPASEPAEAKNNDADFFDDLVNEMIDRKPIVDTDLPEIKLANRQEKNRERNTKDRDDLSDVTFLFDDLDRNYSEKYSTTKVTSFDVENSRTEPKSETHKIGFLSLVFGSLGRLLGNPSQRQIKSIPKIRKNSQSSKKSTKIPDLEVKRTLQEYNKYKQIRKNRIKSKKSLTPAEFINTFEEYIKKDNPVFLKPKPECTTTSHIPELENGIWQPEPSELNLEDPENPKFGLEHSTRKDFRDTQKYCIFSIDPETAADIDDAIHIRVLEKTDKKKIIEIGVHIADTTHFINPETEPRMYEYARQVCVTRYMPHKVEHLMHRNLSSNACSLLEGVDRMTMSIVLEYEGQVLEDGSVNFIHNQDSSTVEPKKLVYLGPGVINSSGKLSYDKVSDAIVQENIDFSKDGKHILDERIFDSVREILEFTKQVRKQRLKFGYADINRGGGKDRFFFDIENEEICENSIKPTDKISMELIEELMIIANYNVGSCFRVGDLIRKHQGLRDKKDLIKKYYQLDKFLKIDYEDFMKMSQSEILRKITNYEFKSPIHEEATKAEIILNTAPAEYKPKSEISKSNIHFGIGEIENYTHFTSPIRRCADQQVHWTLKGNDLARIDYKLKEIPNDIFHANRTIQHEWRKLMGILKIHMDYPDGFPVKLIVFQDPYNLELQKDNFENVLNLQFLISEYEFNPAHENILLKVRKENGDFVYEDLKSDYWKGRRVFGRMIVATKYPLGGSFCIKRKNKNNFEIGQSIKKHTVFDRIELMKEYNVILKPTKLFLNKYGQSSKKKEDITDSENNEDSVDLNSDNENDKIEKSKKYSFVKDERMFKNWFFDYFTVEFLDVKVPGRFNK